MHVSHHCPNALKSILKVLPANLPNPGAADFNLISSNTWSNSLSQRTGLQRQKGEERSLYVISCSHGQHIPLSSSHSTTPRRRWADEFNGWFLLGKNKVPPKIRRTFSSELCKYQLPSLIYTVALPGHSTSAIFVPFWGDRYKKPCVHERKVCWVGFIHLLADRGNC